MAKTYANVDYRPECPEMFVLRCVIQGIIDDLTPLESWGRVAAEHQKLFRNLHVLLDVFNEADDMVDTFNYLGAVEVFNQLSQIYHSDATDVEDKVHIHRYLVDLISTYVGGAGMEEDEIVEFKAAVNTHFRCIYLS